MKKQDVAALSSLLSDVSLQTLLPWLDDFLTRGTRLQSLREDADTRTGAARALSTNARAVFSLFLQLADAHELLQQAADIGLFHVARLVPFCQIYAPKNAQEVVTLLQAVAENVPTFSTWLSRLRQLYIQQLKDLHARVQNSKRNQAVELIHCCYEVALSIAGMTTATSVADALLLDGKDVEAGLKLHEDSLLFCLLQCYEADLPALQRHLATFDDKVALQKLPVIAETRQTLLTVLGRGVDVVLSKQKSTAAGEQVLAGLHALSNGCVEDDAEHGSFLSDLWYLTEYKDKVAEFFDQCKLDLENFSYLGMVIEELPRRRVLPTMLVDELAAEAKPKASLLVDAKVGKSPESAAAASVDDTKPAVSQNDDMESVLTPMVSQVKDFFPDLGEGYVELCLLSSNLQVEVVINFLLESNPPPVLLDVPQSLQRSDAEFVRLEAQITGKPAPPPKVEESKKLDPSRVWVGKKAMEKTYDPQIAKKDQQLVEKMKQLVDMYEEEDLLLSGEGSYEGPYVGVATLDEYDDDYNDEFDDFVPFSIRDGGSADDQDAIREQNRRMRAKEEKDAFWEGMKNRNRETPVNAVQNGEDEEEGEKEDYSSGEQKTWRSNAAAGASQNGPSGLKHKSTRRKDNRQGTAEKKPDEALTPQQIQRQRARKDKNKAKVANHNRKDRAMKKMG